LGESDSQEFVEFVYMMVESKTNPSEIILKLESVFSEGTENFVISLWKCILFEAFKLEKMKGMYVS
jgi:hypothetical protein